MLFILNKKFTSRNQAKTVFGPERGSPGFLGKGEPLPPPKGKNPGDGLSVRFPGGRGVVWVGRVGWDGTKPSVA